MPIVQRFDPEKNLFFTAWMGSVTADEWFARAQNLVHQPLWTQTSRLLADVEWVRDTATIGSLEIEHAIRIFAAQPMALKGKRLAIVAREQFGKAHYFAQLIARYGTSAVVFNNLDTACLFLGMDVEDASRALSEMKPEANGTQV